MNTQSSSSPTSTEPAELRFGIRTAQIATGVILIALLGALGLAALRNADARDREVAFLARVEASTTQVFNSQRLATTLVSALDEWNDSRTDTERVRLALSGLRQTLSTGSSSDILIKNLVSTQFEDALLKVDGIVSNPLDVDAQQFLDARGVISRESRTWLTNYQTAAVGQLRELSGVRGTNERNQAVLLLASLLLSVWLLLWIAVSVGNAYRKARQIVASEEAKVASARSALKHASDQLAFQAQHDALTGLPNRTALMQTLTAALANNPALPVTVLFCDLDRFKVVNDSLGHSIGDELLQEAATRLAKTIRDEDFVARFGGDEFVVVCHDVEDRAGALRIAERITRAMARPFQVHGEEAFIGVSVGITSSKHDSTANQLLRDADVAMYRAKAMPNSHIEFFDAAGDRYSLRFDTENALRRAINNNELLLHWQPIVHVKSGQVHTLEALVRWERPGSGLLLPAEFMGIAEESGLIVDLGRWVISAACSAGALTDDRSVSVNVSARQLRDVNFVDDLREILQESGLPPERLILELTEHTLIEAAVVSAPLRRVRELGVRVALDDFGTGYSSLALLPRLPIDIIKLDRSFLREVTTSEPAQSIIKSLVQLASAIEVMLIVEGVESDAQRKVLRSLGVQHAQGYWFGEPEAGRLTKVAAER